MERSKLKTRFDTHLTIRRELNDSTAQVRPRIDGVRVETQPRGPRQDPRIERKLERSWYMIGGDVRLEPTKHPSRGATSINRGVVLERLYDIP